MIVPDLEALIAEVEERAAGIPKPMLRAFLYYYHEHDRHVAWYTPAVLRDRCTRAAFQSDTPGDAAWKQQYAARLSAHLSNRYRQQFNAGVRPSYSTEVICGYVQEMLDARP